MLPSLLESRVSQLLELGNNRPATLIFPPNIATNTAPADRSPVQQSTTAVQQAKILNQALNLAQGAEGDPTARNN